MAASPARIGILAGGGSLPREVAESVAARGGFAKIVAIEGETTDTFAGLPHAFVRWGEVGRITGELREGRCTHLVIVGSVRRPDLGRLKLDLGFFLALPAVLRSIWSGGDDALLRGVVAHFEGQGFTVAGPAEVAPELVLGKGALGRNSPTPADEADITLGFDLLGRLGPFDVGQGVVVSDGRVLAIEGVEGTDAMLARVGTRRAARPDGGEQGRGVLVKRAKPGQELRVDLPTIGPDTVARAKAAGLAGIAALAGGTLMAGRGDLVRRADAVGVFVTGVDVRGANTARRGPPANGSGSSVRRCGRASPSARDAEDARRGAGVAGVLKAFGAAACVVAVRGHVLAVEADEGVVPTIARAGGLRQWGRSSKRAGVATIDAADRLGAAELDAAVSANLAGLAVLDGSPSADAVDAANRAGLFIAAVGVDKVRR